MARGNECLHAMCVFTLTNIIVNIFLMTHVIFLLYSSVGTVCVVMWHGEGKMATYGFRAISFSPSLPLFLYFLLQMKRILEDLAKEI